MPIRTIANATVTERYTDAGNLCYDIYSNDGYVLYSISEYERCLEEGFPEATWFCRYICATASTDFSDIATMLETDIPEGATIWSKPDNEETI